LAEQRRNVTGGENRHLAYAAGGKFLEYHGENTATNETLLNG